jgi:hypothetical protein
MMANRNVEGEGSGRLPDPGVDLIYGRLRCQSLSTWPFHTHVFSVDTITLGETAESCAALRGVVSSGSRGLPEINARSRGRIKGVNTEGEAYSKSHDCKRYAHREVSAVVIVLYQVDGDVCLP